MNQICARICARDAAGRVETGETRRAERDLARRVRRGQRGEQGRSGTPETGVVVLITQRSQVQILPPLPISQVRGLFRFPEGAFLLWRANEFANGPSARWLPALLAIGQDS